ncbi:hypothetical protein I3F55_33380 [Streptomyces sp. MUM 16J]|nr:hypothetical protein [Streptomyces sp. MUM 16J]
MLVASPQPAIGLPEHLIHHGNEGLDPPAQCLLQAVVEACAEPWHGPSQDGVPATFHHRSMTRHAF